MAVGSIPDTIETIRREGPVLDPHNADANLDSDRSYARSRDDRPETERYLHDESDGYYVPNGGYVCTLAGDLGPAEIANRWFNDLRAVVLEGHWRRTRFALEPLERAGLDLVVVNGPLTRGELYRALVKIQEANPRFTHAPSKTLSQNAHEAIGVPYYANLVRIWKGPGFRPE